MRTNHLGKTNLNYALQSHIRSIDTVSAAKNVTRIRMSSAFRCRPIFNLFKFSESEKRLMEKKLGC